MRTIESIKPNEVIHCPTEQEAIEFCTLLRKSGRTWSNGATYSQTNWKIYKTDTVYNVTDDMYADIEHYKEYGKTITNVKEFLMQNTTQTIPYEGMKEIHDIACSGWKKKIAEWTKVFEDTQLSKEQVNEMFKAASNEQKEVLKKWVQLPKSQIDSITSFKDIEASLGEKIVLPYTNPKTKEERQINATVKCFAIAKVFNEGEILTWENRENYKYIPYRYFDGGSWSAVYCYYWDDPALIPAGLCFKSSELGKKAYELFPEVYDDFYMINPA